MSLILLSVLLLFACAIFINYFGGRLKKNVRHYVYYGDGSYAEFETKKLAMDKVHEVHLDAKNTKTYLRTQNMRKPGVRFAYHKADLMGRSYYSNELPLNSDSSDSKDYDIW